MHPPRLAQRVHQCVGALGGAVHHEQLVDAGVEQRRRDPARAAAGTQQQGAPAAQVQPLALGQIADQADAIGIVCMPAAFRAHQRVRHTHPHRPLAVAARQFEGAALEGQGDVGADATTRGECFERSREVGRAGFDRRVFEVDAGLLREGSVDARRQRMGNRRSEYGVVLAHCEIPG